MAHINTFEANWCPVYMHTQKENDQYLPSRGREGKFPWLSTVGLCVFLAGCLCLAIEHELQ